MTRTLLLGLTALLLALPAGIARADHEVPGGSIGRLHNDAHQLENVVRYSYLRYQVKQAVFRFVSDVSRLFVCTSGDEPRNDHNDHIGSGCSYALDNVGRSWYPVDRYLYDTYYDLPQVYYSYTRVRDDLRVFPIF